MIPLPANEVADEPLDVVVCCASDRLDLVLCTFPGLVAERLLPRVVVGIEAHDEPLIDAIARASGPALFVLCVGASVGGARTRQLVETFVGRKDPLHRLLVLEVNHDRPEALRSTILVAGNGMRRQLAPRASTRISSMRHGGGATAVGGIVDAGETASSEPAVPRPRVVVSQDVADVVCVRKSEAPRPELRLLPPIDDEPADPAATTARIRFDEVADPPASRETKRRRSWIGAAFLLASIACILAFEPDASVADPAETTAITPIEPTPPKTREPQAQEDFDPLAHSPRAGAVSEPPVEPDPLDAALASGRIRELDLLYVTPRYATPSTWRAAATRCKSRTVNGVRGWRLPHVDELRKLWRHRVLLAGVYWSSERAAGAASGNRVFDSSQSSVSTLAKDEHAETICVYRRSR